MGCVELVQTEMDLGLAVQSLETAVEIPGEYSAERLLVSHPDRYEIARRLYFEYSFSKRSVCEMVKIGPNTLDALISREVEARGGEILTKKGEGKRSLIKHRILERVAEMIDDDNIVRDMKPGELLDLIKKVNELEDKLVKHANGSKKDENNVSEAEYAEIMG